MLSNREILNMGFPHNIFYQLGIFTPTDDQIKGLYFVISNLDDRTREMIDLRYKKYYTLRELSNYYNLSYQLFGDKLNKLLRRFSKEKYIILGYEKYSHILIEEQEKQINEQNAYNSFDSIYKRVMLKQDRNKDNIEKIRKYLFDIKNIPMEYKDVSLDYRYGEIGKCFSVRAYNCLRRASFNNIYDLLFKIYENPLYLTKVRNLGRCCFVETFSVLYNLGYITEEQLLFLYLYYNLTCSGVSNFDKLKSYYLNRNRG